MLLLRSLITGDPGAPAGGGTAVVSERPEVRGWMGRLDMETRADFFFGIPGKYRNICTTYIGFRWF